MTDKRFLIAVLDLVDLANDLPGQVDKVEVLKAASILAAHATARLDTEIELLDASLGEKQ